MAKPNGDVIDSSGWVQTRLTSGRGGKRPGAGRKKSADSKSFHTVGLTPDEWEYLSHWSSGNKADQLRELLDRARKFWPSGPAKFR